VKQSPDLSTPAVTRGTTRDFLAVAVLFLGNGLVVGTFHSTGRRPHVETRPGEPRGEAVS
jgi:hypothetical protein